MVSFKNIQTEVDAAYLYSVLAKHESNPAIARVFEQMSDIERGHAISFLKKNNLGNQPFPPPSTRAKILSGIGKIMGYDYILGVLMDTEKSLSNSIQKARSTTQTSASVSDTAHVTILRNILNNQSQVAGQDLSRFEKRHRNVGGNALRAAVLGGNDGLVSNFSLVMGVAGATSGGSGVLITGLAGLLAGALSMALGEWISVKSSQELYENQMELEMDELEHNPEGEQKEIALIYMTKGISEEQANSMAMEIMKDKDRSHALLVKEELGINPDDLKGSAMEAAISSFVLFAIGAIIPVLPFFFSSGMIAIVWSAIASAIGLFFIGATITLFTGKSVWYSGFRQVIFGLLAAAVTFGIGKLIGVNMA